MLLAREQSHNPMRPDEVVAADPSTGDVGSDLVDLTAIDLNDLSILGNIRDTDSTLSRSIRRILREAERPDEAIAGFNSSI
ncbi:MAG: FxSxx-COOH cyclophane-containing RiPP peptide [Frankia sp.]